MSAPKTAAERAKDYRARRQQEQEANMPPSSESLLVDILRAQVADLQRRLDASEERHRMRDERDVERDVTLRHVTDFVTRFVTVRDVTEPGSGLASGPITPAGFGGFGGSRSGSPSSSSASEKENPQAKIQDLNGTQRAHGRLANGTIVPGPLGDVTDVTELVTPSVTRVTSRTTVTDPNADAANDVRRAGGFLEIREEGESPREREEERQRAFEAKLAEERRRLEALAADPSFGGAA